MYIIPIHGIIGEPDNETDEFVTVSDIAMHVNEAKKHESAMLDVDSVGGCVDSADKMKALILTIDVPLYSRNSGDVASAATQLFCIPPKESRSYNPNKGVFLIHNPWGGVTGDANLMQQASKELAEIESRYAKDYVKATGSDIDVIKALMTEDKPLTADQVETLGFAKVEYQTIKAVAKINSNKNKKTMSNQNEEVTKKLGVIESAVAKLATAMSKLTGVKSLMLNDANGKEVEFPEINSIDELSEGTKVMVGGSPYTGEITMQDGTIIVAKDGVVESINMTAGGDENIEALKAENEALKNENAELKASAETLQTENTELKASVDTVKTEVEEVKTVLAEVKALQSGGKPVGSNQPSGNTRTENKGIKFNKSKLNQKV